MGFVHLHVHSHYSLLDGASRIEELVAAAREHRMPAMALTDHGNMFGVFEFCEEARQAGIKPIPGIEAYISPTNRTDRSMRSAETASYHLVLLAMNVKGWRNLLKLSSRAYLEGFYYRPRVDRELLSAHNEGLICLSGCLGGEVPAALLDGDEQKALRIAGEYADIFGRDRFYIEIQKQGYEEQDRINPILAGLAARLGVGLVGTNDVHFIRRDDKRTHEILTCISTGKLLSDEQKLKYSPELYLKCQAEMREALSEWPEAAANSVKIAAMCDGSTGTLDKQLPAFRTPDGRSCGEYLARLANDGLRKRFDGKEPPPAYRERLQRELDVIEEKGYSAYFLIINDCVQFAQGRGIPAGPRGSGVATLLGYALQMTHIDPIRYGLLFERFTDRERKEDPDIDLDICQKGRATVLRYVREKYGYVAQIITYGTLKARAAIRDVGRVMGVPLEKVDAIAKLVPEGPGVTLAEALKDEPDLHSLYEKDAVVKELLDHSMRIEGFARHSGVHAAGVVVCDKPLDDFLPLCRQSESGEVITQWDGPTCGKVGLMKMDFLGLRTLTILQRARELTCAATGKDMDPDKLPLDDQNVFRLFCDGNTDGIFQFESEGMKSVLKQMKPNRIEDLIAANAMYRPGPMKLIPDYCVRKHGRQRVPRVHPLVDDILAETYGVMAYQEQVMQVLNRIGKLPLNRAYTLIKAISKKKLDVIAAEQPQFVKGSADNGIDTPEANKLFELIKEFADYGFNKAHSTRYAIVAYQTAYFKVYHPKEFLAATLTFESDDRDKVVQYMTEGGRMGVTIASPDINKCGCDFAVDGDQVRFGLLAVKGVGEKAVEAIMEARGRAGGAFKDLFHFCRHVDSKAVNRATVEALIKCGAFDSLGGGNRAAMISVLEKAMQSSQADAADRERGQIGLFAEDSDDARQMLRLPAVDSWSREQMMAAERETLGFFVSSHPLNRYARLLRGLNCPSKFTLAELPACADAKQVSFGCLVSQIRTLVCKRGKAVGKKMAVLTVEDLGGRTEVVLYADMYEKHAGMLTPDVLLYVAGSVSKWNERLNVAADALWPLEEAVAHVADTIAVRLPAGSPDGGTVERLRELFGRNRGNCPVRMHLPVPLEGGETSYVSIETGRSWRVKPSFTLLGELEAMVGNESVCVLGKQPAAKKDDTQRFRRKAHAGA